MTLQKKISVVIPSFNEEGNIKIIVKALNEVLQKLNYRYELIFVDDGSSDKTLSILQEISADDANVFYIELSRNFGHQNALKAGLDLASGDCIITMDGDMQHPPEMIPQLVEKWEEGYDIVYTRRLEDKNLPAFKKITSKYFYKFINSISEIKSEEVQEVLIKNEEGIFEEISIPINNHVKELLKASDEDVLSFLDKVSANVLTDVISLIEGRTKSFLSNEEPFKNLDFSEHKELIFSEAKKFVGVLLSKIK